MVFRASLADVVVSPAADLPLLQLQEPCRFSPVVRLAGLAPDHAERVPILHPPRSGFA
jgi:hypothetical protein